jgi:hypothetical protein
MRTSTLVLVSVATLANSGLWLWSRPKLVESSNAAICPLIGQADRLERQVLTSTGKAHPQGSSDIEKVAATTGDSAPIQDQPWLSNVRDGTLQVAQGVQFISKPTMTDLQCQGSACVVTGSIQLSSSGERNSSHEVIQLMNALTDG